MLTNEKTEDALWAMTQMCEKVEGLAEYIFFTRDYLQHVSGIPLQEIKIAYRLLKVFLQELSEENLPKIAHFFTDLQT